MEGLGHQRQEGRPGHLESVNTMTVDEYIAQYPEEIQTRLRTLRDIILGATPNIEERISWGMPSYYLRHVLIHYAVQKRHIGLYPGESGVAAFAGKLTEYKTSKGAIQLPLDRPLPEDLIREIVAFRVEENLGQHHTK